jgi:hypothetical protein
MAAPLSMTAIDGGGRHLHRTLTQTRMPASLAGDFIWMGKRYALKSARSRFVLLR